MTRAPSRRALLAGAFALPALGAPVALAAVAQPDPVFAALERHRTTWKAFNDFCEPHDSPNEVAGWNELEAADALAMEALANTVPTTTSGARALADYLAANSARLEFSPEILTSGLASIARGLAALA
jgi:hypothetical protein